jgi:hypothetical protein
MCPLYEGSSKPQPSDGYTALWERKRLDLTVEALIMDNPEYQSLFDEKTFHTAKRRLQEYEYYSKT